MSRMWRTSSAEETIAVGRTLAELLVPPKLLILRGDLGAGKTTLVKGIAAGLGAAEVDEVTSPTFTLIHEYTGGDDAAGAVRLFHLDLYRLEQERELLTLGLEEIEAQGNIVLVEWGEKFASLVARADGEIAIRITGEDEREISLRLFREFSLMV